MYYHTPTIRALCRANIRRIRNIRQTLVNLDLDAMLYLDIELWVLLRRWFLLKELISYIKLPSQI